MLNAVKLSELLAKNVDSQLYPRMFVMSPNGTLMAYSTPVDIKDLRDQAALISMAWKDHEAALQSKQAKGSSQSEAAQSQDSSTTSLLETLTIEFQHNNIIVRAIQPKLLLVLVGGVPPSRRTAFKITPEAHGDARYPSTDIQEPGPPPTSQPEYGSSSVDSSLLTGEEVSASKKKAASIASHLSQREKDMKIGALHIQRKKIDTMTEFIRADFDSKGFVMPDDSSLT
ncbi:hypothetical protein K469DRAFT_651048 [Zopfia rhizophila CBS 207.26]|uniref:Uncharacterized protein n=1 Tax=Zopfia rhizophila CBS 207.26 TaxID=1314779 RepID=A0A6A6ESI0_9PEZI|nr:hypothetical protein K469DRAFT_651048 [Zopfia rhizophila CBS 207.26]